MMETNTLTLIIIWMILAPTITYIILIIFYDFFLNIKKRADERKVADEKSAVAYAIKLEQANMKAEIERLKLIIKLAELKKKVGE